MQPLLDNPIIIIRKGENVITIVKLGGDKMQKKITF